MNDPFHLACMKFGKIDTFNGACLSAALVEMGWLKENIDGNVIRFFLQDRLDIEILEGGAHYKWSPGPNYQDFNVGDIIRIKHYPTASGFRVWQIIAFHLGGLGQESTYELKVLDMSENKTINIPCVLLESNIFVEKI